jgi:hypothetical protein
VRVRLPDFCPLTRLYYTAEDLFLGVLLSVLVAAWGNVEESIAAGCPCGNHDGKRDDA